LASIILLRHGQSVHHVTDLTGGWTDTGLTALGRRQASCVAARLAREIADAPYPLYTSDLLRASQTAAIIGRALNIAPAPEPGLRGYNNGIARGLTRQEADRIQAPRSRPFIDWRPCPESETWREFYTRTSSCMERLHATGQSLLIVTHGGVLINSIIWWLRLGVEQAERVSFDAAPASITVLRINQWGERTIERLNDTAHLQCKGLTPSIRISDE